ncbi:MAG: histidine phosphatase family protein [Alphaproteobacteria bacterium]|nr:histidine phosphatase family protein [Alphaproteobacteria bacterium]
MSAPSSAPSPAAGSPFGPSAIGAGDTAAATTRFWWVRHAPVAHQGRIYGQTDLPCDCSDAAVFAGLARQLPREAAWVVSNLRRTHETAQAMRRAGLPGPDPIPGPEAPAIADLAEQDFGDWQGMTYEALQESRGGSFHRFWHAPAHEKVPGGESFIEVMHRVAAAIHDILAAYRGRDIIAVAHGGTIRSALGLALGLEPEACLAFTLENCSITRIDHVEGPGMGHGWRVVTVNRPPR